MTGILDHLDFAVRKERNKSRAHHLFGNACIVTASKDFDRHGLALHLGGYVGLSPSIEISRDGFRPRGLHRMCDDGVYPAPAEPVARGKVDDRVAIFS